MKAWPTSCCCSNRMVGTPATPVQSAWHWGCAETSQATNSSPQSRNTPVDIVRRCTRVPRARCSCGSPKATAAKRQQHGNTAPVDDDLGRKRLPHSEATPSWGTAPCAAPCLSVCLLWSDGSIRQVARGGCAVAERPAAQHPGASWALRAPPFIYSPQGGEHFDHCC